MVLVPLRVFRFKTSSVVPFVVPFVVPLRVEIMEEFYDSAFYDLIAYANYEYDRLCFIFFIFFFYSQNNKEWSTILSLDFRTTLRLQLFHDIPYN